MEQGKHFLSTIVSFVSVSSFARSPKNSNRIKIVIFLRRFEKPPTTLHAVSLIAPCKQAGCKKYLSELRNQTLPVFFFFQVTASGK